jgi:uncharacterized protein
MDKLNVNLAPSEQSTELVTHSEDEDLLRMLLVDSARKRSYVFDPETSRILLVTEPIATAILRLQDGEALPSDVVQQLVQKLQLGEYNSPTKERHPWGVAFHLNHACNLACSYCYADGRTSDGEGTAKGAYGGPVSYMRQNVLHATANKMMRDSPNDVVTAILWGGEPLLSEERFIEAVAVIDQAAKDHDKTVRYQMTTNGTLLSDAVLKCLAEHSFELVVSVDGSRETHNRQRPKANGRGSYDEAVKAVQRAAEAGISVGVRGTAMRGTGSFADDHYGLARCGGLGASLQFNCYGEDAVRPISEAEAEELFEHYYEVANRILDGDQEATKLETVKSVLASIIGAGRRQFQCGAGRWYLAVGTNGDVFPCHRFVGMSAFRQGNVLDDNFRFKSIEAFERNSVRNRRRRRNGAVNCSLCYAHNVCGGGCAQIGAATTGAIGELPPFYCAETRLRVRAAVRALAERASSRPMAES